MQIRQQQIRNLAFALTFCSWGVLRIVSAIGTPNLWTIGQLVPAALHFVVALLFLLRAPSQSEGGTKDVLAAVPSFIAGGLLVMLAGSPVQWPSIAHWIFAIGGLGTAWSLLTLGRSFAIFPAVRTIVSTGPYRTIRNPAYAFEILMLFGVCLAVGWHGAPLLLLAIVFYVIRIVTEENLLRTTTAYRSYVQAVKYRLIPRVW